MSPAADSTGGDEVVDDVACYVYGIVPYDVELDPEARGVGDPPARVGIVRHGDVAALVSQAEPAEPPRRPGDLAAHRDLLDAAAAEVPVLPVRFGTVAANRAALIDQLLGPHHDQFAAALRELEGRAEYLIEGIYDEGPEGEAEPGVAVASTIIDRVGRYCAATHVRDRPDEDGADVAVLMDTSRQGDLERDVAELAHSCRGQADLRVRGPFAAYDFVTALTPGD